MPVYVWLIIEYHQVFKNKYTNDKLFSNHLIVDNCCRFRYEKMKDIMQESNEWKVSNINERGSTKAEKVF